MRPIGLFTDDLAVELVLEYGEHPGAILYRTGQVVGWPLRVECRDDDVMVTLGVRPVSSVGTPPIDRMVAYEEPGADEVPLIHQRAGAYGIVLSERGLLDTVTSRLTGAPGTWNLSDGSLDTGEEPTASLLREVHEETDQQVVPGRLLTLQSDRWTDRAPNGGLEDYHVPRIIYSTACRKPSRPRVHDLGGSTARAGWAPVKFWRRIPWTRVAQQVLSRHLPSR